MTDAKLYPRPPGLANGSLDKRVVAAFVVAGHYKGSVAPAAGAASAALAASSRAVASFWPPVAVRALESTDVRYKLWRALFLDSPTPPPVAKKTGRAEIAELKAKIAAAEKELAQLRAAFKEKHPDLHAKEEAAEAAILAMEKEVAKRMDDIASELAESA